MPHRSIVAVVIIAWLAANCLLFYREVWPHWRVGGPPPYAIDLTEELGKTHVNWRIFMAGKPAGNANSHVERQRDRTYRLHTNLRFNNLRLGNLELIRISTTYHVTEEGELLDLAVVFQFRLKNNDIDLPSAELAMDGVVKNGEIEPKLSFNGEPVPLGEGKVSISEGGSVLNPMHLLSRIPGLSEGRHWRMPLLDPMKALKAFPVFAAVLPTAQKMTAQYLNASVVGDTLHWNGDDVECYKVEYRQTNELDPVAETWVRRRDGLVLQQRSSSGLMEMTLVREMPR